MQAHALPARPRVGVPPSAHHLHRRRRAPGRPRPLRPLLPRYPLLNSESQQLRNAPSSRICLVEGSPSSLVVVAGSSASLAVSTA